MNYKEVLNKDEKRFERLNEQVNVLAEKYGVKTAIKMVKNRLYEEGEQQPAAQPAQGGEQQAAAQPQQAQAPAVDFQKMLGELKNVGQTFQQFAQSYQNSPYAKDLVDLFNGLKALAGKVQADAQKPAQPQQNQADAQQQSSPAQGEQQPAAQQPSQPAQQAPAQPAQ